MKKNAIIKTSARIWSKTLNRLHTRIALDEIKRILALWGAVYRGGYPKLDYLKKSTEQLIHDGETYLFESPEADHAERTILKLEKPLQKILIHYYCSRMSHTSSYMSSSTYYRKLDEAERRFGEQYGRR